jgi:hypothetical protein
MQVTIKRTGGFAGFNQTLVTKDLDALPARKRNGILRRLRTLTEHAAEDEPVGADMLTYEVETTDVPDVPGHLAIADTGDENEQLRRVTALIEALG